MLDVRVYRAAFVPALIALFVAAFSLTDRPRGVTTPFAPDAFDGTHAFTSLAELGRAFPRRPAGSDADRALADRVAREFRSGGFRVSRRTFAARTLEGEVDVENVVGVRPGLSNRRIVVMAHRDARGAPALAELSGTVALLELARIFRVRDLSSTLVLVSTSGGSGGAAGARAFAEDAVGPVDAVLVLGDVASGRIRKPWIVPWSNGDTMAPHGLRRTLERAVRQEVGSPAGGARAIGQWARRAVPFTVSEQGEAARGGLPAVLLQVTGERGPGVGAPVSEEVLDAFGRAALRAVTALEGASSRAEQGGPFGGEPRGVVTVRRVLPDWAVRLLVGTLLLPGILTAVDAFFRARRRRLPVARWLAWTALAALPFALAWLWVRLLGLTGAVTSLPAPVLPAAVPLSGGALVAFLSAIPVLALGWFALRGRLVHRLGLPASLSAGGAAAALGLAVNGLAVIVWLGNPYAAALLVPAVHGWLWAAAPGTSLRSRTRVPAVLGGVALPALLLLHYALALDIGPVGLAWSAFLATAGGHVSVPAALVAAALAGCLAGVIAVTRAHRDVEVKAPPEPLRTRGPATYAGPGSLGGTESALRR